MYQIHIHISYLPVLEIFIVAIGIRHILADTKHLIVHVQMFLHLDFCGI